jgi:hypothetical protein
MMRERDESRGSPPGSGTPDADLWADLPTMTLGRGQPEELVDLIVRLSVSEGDVAGGRRMVLYISLQSRIGRLRAPRPELLVLCRAEAGLPPPWISKSAVARQDVAWLKTLLEASGMPGRTPRLIPTPRRGPSRGRRWVELEVRMCDQARTLKLCLEPAGFAGPDAWPIAAVLERIGQLAEAAGRPMVRAMLESLAPDRSRVDRRGRACAPVAAKEAYPPPPAGRDGDAVLDPAVSPGWPGGSDRPSGGRSPCPAPG